MRRNWGSIRLTRKRSKRESTKLSKNSKGGVDDDTFRIHMVLEKTVIDGEHVRNKEREPKPFRKTVSARC